jgi:hypothetical protein
VRRPALINDRRAIGPSAGRLPGEVGGKDAEIEVMLDAGKAAVLEGTHYCSWLGRTLDAVPQVPDQTRRLVVVAEMAC